MVVAYLQEAVDEVARQPGLGLLFCAEVLEDVRQLLPVVEGFLNLLVRVRGRLRHGAAGEGTAYLELLVAVEEQHVDGPELVYVSVALEFLAHLGSQLGDGHAERVHVLDLRGLWSALAVVLCLGTASSLRILALEEQLQLLRRQQVSTYRAQPVPVAVQHPLLRIRPVHRCGLVSAPTIPIVHQRID